MEMNIDMKSAPFNIPFNRCQQELTAISFSKYEEAIPGILAEIWSRVFSSVLLETAVALSRVNRQFYVISSPLAKIARMAFGRAKWVTYFGDVGQEPPLPPDIDQILAAPCPFWAKKKVEETHMLVLIPKIINGKLFTLAGLAELIKMPKQGNATQFACWSPGGTENLSVAHSYWVLMTRDVLEDTRKKPYSDQKQIVARFCQKTGLGYQVPKLLEAATCILVEYVSRGIRLYSDKPHTYTRCEEKSEKSDYQMEIGGFAVGGLVVHCCPFAFVHDFGGAAALRRF